MHPELYLVVHRQAERELVARLEHRRVAAERGLVAPLPAPKAVLRSAARARGRAQAAAAALTQTLTAPGGQPARDRATTALRLDDERCAGAVCSA
jgi:hypothetical protein